MTPISYLRHTANVIINDPQEHCQKHWAAGNFYECHANGLLTWAFNNMPHAGIYIDIGANIGNHTLFMWKIMGAKSVFSIEADYKHHQNLKENLLINQLPIHTIFNIALSDFDGFGELIYDSTPSSQGGAMMGRLIESRGGNIEVMKFDSFDSDWFTERITWMKLDIEGSEYNALRGGAEFIRSNKPLYISCECMDDSSRQEINEFLIPFGYSIVSGQLNHTPTYVWKHAE